MANEKRVINCQIEIRYICKHYAQISCPFFKSLGSVTTTNCEHGFPDRKCRSKEANTEALKNYLETKKWLK